MNKAIKNRTIDGKTFVITKLGVEDSLKVLIWLTKSLGGSVAKSLGEFQSLADLKDDDEVDLTKFSGALDNVFERMDEKETLEKIEILLSCVSHETQNLNYNSAVLMGNPMLTLKLAKESLGVNYKDFLGGISAAVANVRSKLAQKGTTPEEVK